MKVKIFDRVFSDDLEKDINNFLIENSNKKIIDIKYASNDTALIMYESEDK